MHVPTPEKYSQDEVYISVDIEADGPIPGDYSMISIGAVVIGREQDSFYEEIAPISSEWVPEALAVSGFTREQTLGFASPQAAMLRFADWLDQVRAKYAREEWENGYPTGCTHERRLVMVGFNATFDWMFVHWYLMHFEGRNPLGISALDIKAFYMGYAASDWSETSMKHLPQKLQPPDGLSHNALDDARDQAEIFQKIILLSAAQSGAIDELGLPDEPPHGFDQGEWHLTRYLKS